MVKDILKKSRPKFWMYTLGPYLIGYISSVQNIYFWDNINFWIYFLYFMIPANIIIYGVNDLADRVTDQYNIRKLSGVSETLTSDKLKKPLILAIIISILLGVLLTIGSHSELSIMLLFFILSIFYSIKPIRFKARPFIDAYSNILYIMPAIFAYYMMTSSSLDPVWIVIGTLYVAGMQVYSAIPDIEADKQEGLNTTAIFLGHYKALLFVAINWVLGALLTFYLVPGFTIILFIFPAMAAVLYFQNEEKVAEYYKYFPYINSIVGFLLFWYILIAKFGIDYAWQSALSVI